MSQGFSVEYSPEAYEDLEAIYSYIAFRLKERQTAADLIGRIRREVRALRQMPERYAPVDWEPWASMGMRKLPVGRFVVYYLVDQRRVRVVRVFYGGRDVPGIIQAETE